MKSTFTLSIRNRIEKAVYTLCPIIESQVCDNTDANWDEYALRHELVACILGSQVRHDMAVSALECIEQAGLIDDCWWQGIDDTFESKIFDLLSGYTSRNNVKVCYRFPKVRSHQLAEARNAVAKRSLSERLSDSSDPKQLRQLFVAEISGFGPKQASMFLRNIGISYDLAILDTHVLRFMDMQQLLCLNHVNISTVPAYERTEGLIVQYANSLGYPVGYLDWAIWATMRAARELGL